MYINKNTFGLKTTDKNYKMSKSLNYFYKNVFIVYIFIQNKISLLKFKNQIILFTDTIQHNMFNEFIKPTKATKLT